MTDRNELRKASKRYLDKQKLKQAIARAEECFTALRAAGVDEIPPRQVWEQLFSAETDEGRRYVAESYSRRYERRGSLLWEMADMPIYIAPVRQYQRPGSLIESMI